MNLHDLIDPIDYDLINQTNSNLTHNQFAEPKKDNIVEKSLKEINYLDSIEYLKYSNQYLHDKLIIANTKYKLKHSEQYAKFKELKLIRSTEKYTLEYYIKKNYRLVNGILDLHSKKMQTDPKKFFKMEKLHDPANILVNIMDPTIRGTIYDKAISYIYDNTIDFLTVVRSCGSVPELDTIIAQNKIIDSKEMIFALFGDQLNKIKPIIDNMFSNMSPCKIIYSHDTKTYGYPDFIADNWIVDIKTSKTSVLNMKNYLQVVGYAVCAGLNGVCLYDIENGCIYKGVLKPKTIDKIRKLL